MAARDVHRRFTRQALVAHGGNALRRVSASRTPEYRDGCTPQGYAASNAAVLRRELASLVVLDPACRVGRIPVHLLRRSPISTVGR